MRFTCYIWGCKLSSACTVEAPRSVSISTRSRPSSLILMSTLSRQSYVKALEARLRQRTNHPTIKDATQAMRILGIMLSTYRPPNRDVPEGFKRLFVLPFNRQPAGGMWTEELIEQLLQDVETSPDGWSDDGKPVAWTHSPPAASSGPGRGSWRGRGQSIGFRPYSRPPIEHGFVGQDSPPGGYRYQARPQHISPQLAFRPGQSGGQTMLGFRADSWHTRADRTSQPPPQQ